VLEFSKSRTLTTNNDTDEDQWEFSLFSERNMKCTLELSSKLNQVLSYDPASSNNTSSKGLENLWSYKILSMDIYHKIVHKFQNF
jgi:hypothetical protein